MATESEIQPQTSENQIVGGLFNPEERWVCEQIAAGNPPWSQRAQALLAMDKGASEAVVGKSIGLRDTQVKYWLGKFQKVGMDIFPELLLKEAVAAPANSEISTHEDDLSAPTSPGKAKNSKKPKEEKDKGSKKKAKKSKNKKNKGRVMKKSKKKKMNLNDYEKELERLQLELVNLQEWIRFKKLKVVVIFEGRDTAGKGGIIKRIIDRLNPRVVRVVALGVPTEKESSQWYFQRYVPHLPAAGEMVLFDRSWYNRAGVEKVMGFCTEDEYWEFLRSCPEFERMLVRSGVILIKYWLSVSDEEQERRFLARIDDPLRQWKLSPMDVASRSKWVEYSRAKDEMFKYTDIKQAPWWVVNADVKRHARLNLIHHLLSQIPYEDLTPEAVELPPRQENSGYVRPPIEDQTFVPEKYQ